jgi:hypothetical protein
MKKFEENVAYLQRNIPPDDIYLFAEETLMAALYFMHRWSKKEDINTVCKEDEVARKWVSNILGLQRLREKALDVDLDLGIDVMEE